MAQNARYSIMDPEYAALMDTLPDQEKYPKPLPYEEQKQGCDQYLAKLKAEREPSFPPESEITVKDYTIPVDGGEILVRTLIPKAKEGEDTTFPLLFWMHGGGWVFLTMEVDDHWLRDLCVQLRMSIINVDYRLAPQHPFPTGINDCSAALKWTVENAALLSADLKKGFILGGLSAGGNGAAVLAHRTRDDPFFKDRKPSGVLLQYPSTIHPDAYPEQYKSELLSIETDRNAPFLSTDEMIQGWGWLNPPPTDPDYSVLLAAHHNLPPTFLQIAGLDPLRDEAILYERLIREAGNKTRIEVYAGLPHAVHDLFPQAAVSVRFKKDFHDGLRWLLSGGQ